MYGCSLRPFLHDNDKNSKNYDLIRGYLIQRKLSQKNIFPDETQKVRNTVKLIRRDLLSYARCKVFSYWQKAPIYLIFFQSKVLGHLEKTVKTKEITKKALPEIAKILKINIALYATSGRALTEIYKTGEFETTARFKCRQNINHGILTNLTLLYSHAPVNRCDKRLHKCHGIADFFSWILDKK